MKGFKKICANVLAVATVFSLGTMAACGKGGEGASNGRDKFIETLGGVSETYVGEVSEETYATQEQAAEAYVQEQIVGEKDVSIVNATSKGSLGAAEIAALEIPAEDSEGIVSVEEVEVEYSENEEIVPMASAPTNTKKVKVYIIKYTDYYKYFTPCPVTGETVNKSYYDSVFNSEKYKNCTVESTVTETVTGSAQGQTVVMNVEMSQFVKFTENAIYLEVSTKSESKISSQAGGVEESKIYGYITQDDDGMSCWVKKESANGESLDWTKGDLTAIGFWDIEELAPFHDQYLDYTYFTKTDYGFTLAEENAAKYIEEVFKEFGVYLQQGGKLDMFAEYYVCGGVLSGMRMDMDLNLSVQSAGITVQTQVKANAVTKVTDYGKTTVTKPF